ncbi:uncharacterized protein RAG0_10556 [Rhynchosporium agropyri]|uniref:Heterokaryon incompatibility domain-containing protein n=1 Tax=Rhynchosporium agropyri TaxID=914238 RepID=A0A1E1L0B6_9HELO|nr:uncharacterized protein RAG0_10556 [Rhynchosporium agropyri]
MASSFADEMPHYQYSALDQAGEGDIRLIRLWPGTFDEEEIRLGIFHVPRSSKPVYEALSYAWGCPDHTDHVLVSESDRRQERGLQRDFADLEIQETVESAYTLGIAHKLSVALRHLRHSDRARVLWVDAVCINQKNDVEKGREVLLMESIYRNARQVIVWLAPEEDDSSLALKTSSRLGHELRTDRSN